MIRKLPWSRAPWLNFARGLHQNELSPSQIAGQGKSRRRRKTLSPPLFHKNIRGIGLMDRADARRPHFHVEEAAELFRMKFGNHPLILPEDGGALPQRDRVD